MLLAMQRLKLGRSYLFVLIAFLLTLPTFRGFDHSLRNQSCSNFNEAAALSALVGIDDTFVCPADGIAGKLCTKPFSMKSPESVAPSNLQLSEVLFYVLVGPKSKVDAFKWWLRLVENPIDMVMISDPCEDANEIRFYTAENVSAATCSDGVTDLRNQIAAEFPNVRLHIARVRRDDVGYKILSCKVRSGALAIYRQFPDKKFYFKLDTDSIIFPRRLLHFMRTMDSVADTGHAYYFGTVEESGGGMLLCGTSGYNLSMNVHLHVCKYACMHVCRCMLSDSKPWFRMMREKFPLH
jgi:hypothetical protein